MKSKFQILKVTDRNSNFLFIGSMVFIENQLNVFKL